MKEEFNLSKKKRILIPEISGESFYWKKEEDVKEFIKRLKEEIRNDMTTHPNKHIDKLAGKELVK